MKYENTRQETGSAQSPRKPELRLEMTLRSEAARVTLPKTLQIGDSLKRRKSNTGHTFAVPLQVKRHVKIEALILKSYIN